MLYEISLQNGPVWWIAHQTSEKEKADLLRASVKAQYIYLRVFDDLGNIVSIRCQSNKWIVSPM